MSMRPRSNMEPNPEDLAKITDFTLRHYNEHAEDFWEGTRDHNVNQNITALLQRHGPNEEGWNDGRYGVYHNLDTWRSYVSAPDSLRLITITAPPDCHAKDSPG